MTEDTPPHFHPLDHEIDQALALFYDGDHAPIVTNMQFGEAAQWLAEIAQEHNIPIYENPQLLEQLSHLTVGDEIPTEMYRLIAEILAFAFFIQGKTPEGY